MDLAEARESTHEAHPDDAQYLNVSAQRTYHTCTEEVAKSGLMTKCSLPDTFQSWFLVTQLHLWMCMVRAKKEGKDGHYVCQQLVSLFWYDVEHRIKLTGVRDQAGKRVSHV